MGRRGNVGRRRTKQTLKPKNAANNAKKKARRLRNRKTECPAVRDAYHSGKTLRTNMEEMGLAYDLKTCMRPSKSQPMDTDSAPIASKRSVVVMRLEREAAAMTERPAEKRLPENDVLFCVRMMRMHGEDFKAMARDAHNLYQETPKQIARKINRFKCSPQFRAYEIALGETAS